jgi:hypothetical protein
MVGRYKRKNANSRTAYAHTSETTISAALIRNDFSRTIKAPHAVRVSQLKRDDDVGVMYRPRKPGSSFAHQNLDGIDARDKLPDIGSGKVRQLSWRRNAKIGMRPTRRN